jgi:hypothetical protein
MLRQPHRIVPVSCSAPRNATRACTSTLLGGLLTCCLWACGPGGSAETLAKSGPALSPGDFVDPSIEVIPAETARVAPVTPANTIGPLAATGGIFDVTALPGRPGQFDSAAGAVGSIPALAPPGAVPMTAPPAVAREPGEAVSPPALIDVKVGDINGKPIYANSFLDDMADQLRAETQRMDRREWIAFAGEKITEKLNLQIRDELLRAEAVNNFSPEQRQGFFAFMQTVQRRIESQSQGSRAAADERLEATEGMSLDQYMKKREQEELIRFQLGEKIDKRVAVPWRDIKQEYDRFYDTFNPAPKARFRLLQIPKDNPTALAAFDSARAAGTSLEEIAKDKSINRYKPETGGLEERDIKGERAKVSFFGNDALNNAARTINTGELAGPFAVGDNQAYLYLEEIVTRSRSLYDAQMDIEAVLRRRRTAQATQEYIDRLRERGNVTDLASMQRELMQVADGRFWPAGKS